MPVSYPASVESAEAPRMMSHGTLTIVSPAALRAAAPAGSVYLAEASFSRAGQGELQHFRAGTAYILQGEVKAALLASGAPIREF